MQYIISDYGIKNVGHFALRCLRIEKFIPFWGEEITGDTTPNEVNRAYKVKFDKQYFIGKLESCFQRAAKIKIKVYVLREMIFKLFFKLYRENWAIRSKKQRHYKKISPVSFGSLRFRNRNVARWRRSNSSKRRICWVSCIL